MKWDDLNFIIDWNDYIAIEDRLKFMHAESAFCRAESDAFTACQSDENRQRVLDKRLTFLLEVIKYRKHDIRLKSPQLTILKPRKR